jgi:hypothetical protein
LFCTVHYPFASGAAADDIRLALGRCPELRPANATFWNWIGPKQPAKAFGVQKQPSKSQTFTTTLDDGSLVLGNVELKDKALILSVNSMDWWLSLWLRSRRLNSAWQRAIPRRRRT